jgi:hypothetical protein
MATAALGQDPLIAEAKERTRRRRLLLLGAVVLVAGAAIGGTLATRSSANSLGVCATAPSGFQERTLPARAEYGGVAPAAVVLTNFRFGRMADTYGLTDRFNWPANGVTVAVSNEPPWGGKGGVLHFTARDFGGIEGSTQPSGQMIMRSHGRTLNALVEVGAITPATIAAANRALASVRVCSA